MEHMTDATTRASTVPEGTPSGVCLLEIWRTPGTPGPRAFWREVQSDGAFSLWRIMDASAAKKSLRMRTFTLGKDAHRCTYAARPFDVRTATPDDYARLARLRAGYRNTWKCLGCQDTREVQVSTASGRVVAECPECAPA
jgi:hypothetical protein